MNSLKKLIIDMDSLIIFRHILSDKIILRFLKLIKAHINSDKNLLNIYCEFIHKLFLKTENLSLYIWEKIRFEENIYALKKAKKETVRSDLDKALERELKILMRLSSVKSQDIKINLPYGDNLLNWINEDIDFLGSYNDYIENIERKGYGIYSKHLMFSFDDKKIKPIKSPDTTRLNQLLGYELARKKIIHNTLALIEGEYPSNALLYGDAGTGKSSTIKALALEYGHMGLRLIEVRKENLLELPLLMEKLRENPLKFIIFIDDLSFPKENDDISSLKALLEGTAYKKAPNMVIYATSNRRHIIRETFSDRGNDDIHLRETIEEQTSLADRFGLMIGFFRPNREEYLEIVTQLAKQYELKNTEDLEALAENYALKRGGRTGRTARQFIEHQKNLESLSL